MHVPKCCCVSANTLRKILPYFGIPRLAVGFVSGLASYHEAERVPTATENPFPCVTLSNFWQCDGAIRGHTIEIDNAAFILGNFFSGVYHFIRFWSLTLSATHAHLAVLGIEATACVTILERIIRRPPARGALFTRSGSAANQAQGQMTNWPARAAQMISWPARASLYKEQQGIDKLARSGSAP